jgi:hypothetical protein
VGLHNKICMALLAGCGLEEHRFESMSLLFSFTTNSQ